jgi:hypothetical protein
MSFSLFNQDTDLKNSPSPNPLPQGRKKEADLPGKGGARPASKGNRISSPGGEGRVRGLFLGMGEQNNEVKPAPGKRMDFRRSKCCKWHCIIRSAIYPSRNPPTNSFEEAEREETQP